MKISPTEEGLELTLTVADTAESLWDRWELYFDFRPAEKRFGLHDGNVFHFAVHPVTHYGRGELGKYVFAFPRSINYLPKPEKDQVLVKQPYVDPELSVPRPLPIVDGTRSEKECVTRVVLPWKDLEAQLGARPKSFAFAAEYKDYVAGEPIPRAARLFANDATSRVNNGWPSFALDPKQSGLRVVAESGLLRSLADMSPIKDHPPPDKDTASGSVPPQRIHPLTGEPSQRIFRPAYGCASPVSTSETSFFRSGFISYYDYPDDSGVRNIPGARPGCWGNSGILPAMGLVVYSERSSGCGCNYNFHTSFALAPSRKRDNEDWAIFYDFPADAPIRELNLNFGVPGDRRDEERKLWLAFPRPWDRVRPSLVVPAEVTGLDGMETYRFNANRRAIQGTRIPWVYASGYRGATRIAVKVGGSLEFVSLPVAEAPVIDGQLNEPCWNQTNSQHAVTIRFAPIDPYFREHWDSARDQESLKDWCVAPHDATHLYLAFFDDPVVDRRGTALPWKARATGRDSKGI